MSWASSAHDDVNFSSSMSARASFALADVSFSSSMSAIVA